MSRCVFCEIINKEINSSVVYEDKSFIAVHDISPLAPVHVLVMPKKHYGSILECNDTKTLGEMYRLAASLAKQLNVAETGFRLVINTGVHGGQTVPHMHLHLLASKPLGGLC